MLLTCGWWASRATCRVRTTAVGELLRGGGAPLAVRASMLDICIQFPLLKEDKVLLALAALAAGAELAELVEDIVTGYLHRGAPS